jgi:hypothetical protein
MFQYGFGQLQSPRSNGCGTNGLSCSASATHLALQAIFHPAPENGGQALYVDGSLTPSDGTNTHLHEWLTFGLRGNFNL